LLASQVIPSDVPAPVPPRTSCIEDTFPGLGREERRDERQTFISPMPISVKAWSLLPESLFAVTTSCNCVLNVYCHDQRIPGKRVEDMNGHKREKGRQDGRKGSATGRSSSSCVTGRAVQRSQMLCIPEGLVSPCGASQKKESSRQGRPRRILVVWSTEGAEPNRSSCTIFSVLLDLVLES
jgi:hypothetical protein